MRKLIKLLICSTILIGCEYKNSQNQKIFISGFNSGKWRNDSIACIGDRGKMVGQIIDNKKELKGKNKNDIILFLGHPNVEARSYRFFVEKGVQCMGYVTKKGFDSLETASLVLDFDKKDIVKNVRMIK